MFEHKLKLEVRDALDGLADMRTELRQLKGLEGQYGLTSEQAGRRGSLEHAIRRSEGDLTEVAEICEGILARLSAPVDVVVRVSANNDGRWFIGVGGG
jgi:hypothetical protein